MVAHPKCFENFSQHFVHQPPTTALGCSKTTEVSGDRVVSCCEHHFIGLRHQRLLDQQRPDLFIIHRGKCFGKLHAYWPFCEADQCFRRGVRHETHFEQEPVKLYSSDHHKFSGHGPVHRGALGVTLCNAENHVQNISHHHATLRICAACFSVMRRRTEPPAVSASYKTSSSGPLSTSICEVGCCHAKQVFSGNTILTQFVESTVRHALVLLHSQSQQLQAKKILIGDVSRCYNSRIQTELCQGRK